MKAAAARTDDALDLAQRAWLSPAHAALFLDITLKGLRRRLERGTIPAWTYSRFGGSLRFDRRALDQWLSEKRGGAGAFDTTPRTRRPNAALRDVSTRRTR